MQTVALVSGVLSVITIVVTVGLLVLVGVRATGRARAAGMAGFGLFIVQQLASPFLGLAYDWVSDSSDRFSTFVIVQSLVLTLFATAGSILLALAIIWGSIDARAQRANPPGPPQPGPGAWTQPDPYLS